MPDTKSAVPVHIDDLFDAFQRFDRKARIISSTSLRSPAKWHSEMAAARDEFKAFCDEYNLPVDFTPRD